MAHLRLGLRDPCRPGRGGRTGIDPATDRLKARRYDDSQVRGRISSENEQIPRSLLRLSIQTETEENDDGGR